MDHIAVVTRALVCSLIFTFSTNSFAQPDTMQVRALYDSARTYYLSDGQKTLQFAQAGYDRSVTLDYYWGEMNSLQMIGEAYFTLGDLALSTETFEQALELARSKDDVFEEANNLVSLATVAVEMGDKDAAKEHYRLAIGAFEALRDSSSMCDALLRLGNVYSQSGEHDEAIAQYLHSIKCCEAVDNQLFVGYNYGSIAIIHDKQGDYEIAEEYFIRARDVFKAANDPFSYGSILNNMGIFYKNTGAYDKAMEAYAGSLHIFDSLNYRRGMMAGNGNLGILHTNQGNYERGQAYSRRGYELALELGIVESQGENLNQLARAQLGLGQSVEAIRNAREALRLADTVQSLENLRDANLTLSEIFETLGRTDSAMAYYRAHVAAKDSLYSLDKTKQINELRLQFETERKDAEIRMLAKNAELDRVKKTRLWIGLLLSLCVGALIIANQWQRRRAEKKIHLQEQAIEQERRRNAELEQERLGRELDFKKQELAAKVLQLARKNEFLQHLDKKVLDLREHTEGEAHQSARALSRMIQYDVVTETDWDDFLASFREVHQDFINGMQSQYEGLSKTDLKLACLMKMNLSSKEIAGALNISQMGVKKARYRLRKKLGLDSEQNVQEYLLAYPN